MLFPPMIPASDIEMHKKEWKLRGYVVTGPGDNGAFSIGKHASPEVERKAALGHTLAGDDLKGIFGATYIPVHEGYWYTRTHYHEDFDELP